MGNDQPTAGVALKPCPHCGGDRAHTFYVRDGRQAGCPDCGARSGAAFHGRADQPSAEDRAVEAWNTRTPASGAVEAIVKELRLAACGLFNLNNDRGDYGYFDDLADRLAALTSSPKAEVEVHERNLSASNAELLEQALAHPPLSAPQPLQGGEVTMEELVHPVAMVIDSAPGDWSADDLARELLALIFAAIISPARREGED